MVTGELHKQWHAFKQLQHLEWHGLLSIEMGICFLLVIVSISYGVLNDSLVNINVAGVR